MIPLQSTSLLKKLLCEVLHLEESLDEKRDSLSSLHSFEPYAAYQRVLKSSRRRHMRAEDLQRFLMECSARRSFSECLLFIRRYSLSSPIEHQDYISFKQFLCSMMPIEDSGQREVIALRPNQRFDIMLSDMKVDVYLSGLLDYEVRGLTRIDRLKGDLRDSSSAATPEKLFALIDREGIGFIDADAIRNFIVERGQVISDSHMQMIISHMSGTSQFGHSRVSATEFNRFITRHLPSDETKHSEQPQQIKVKERSLTLPSESFQINSKSQPSKAKVDSLTAVATAATTTSQFGTTATSFYSTNLPQSTHQKDIPQIIQDTYQPSPQQQNIEKYKRKHSQHFSNETNGDCCSYSNKSKQNVLSRFIPSNILDLPSTVNKVRSFSLAERFPEHSFIYDEEIGGSFQRHNHYDKLQSPVSEQRYQTTAPSLPKKKTLCELDLNQISLSTSVNSSYKQETSKKATDKYKEGEQPTSSFTRTTEINRFLKDLQRIADNDQQIENARDHLLSTIAPCTAEDLFNMIPPSQQYRRTPLVNGFLSSDLRCFITKTLEGDCEGYEAVFAFFDSKQRGLISKEEFLQKLQPIACTKMAKKNVEVNSLLEPQKKEVLRFFLTVISHSTKTRGIKRKYTTTAAAGQLSLNQLFDALDKDNDSRISLNDLVKSFSEAGLDFSEGLFRRIRTRFASPRTTTVSSQDISYSDFIHQFTFLNI